MKTRIRQVKSGCYVIDEVVTTRGEYITWPGLFKTKEGAQKEIETVKRIQERNSHE